MRMSVIVVLAACALTAFMVLSCGPRQASMAQTLLGKWQIVDNQAISNNTDLAQLFERGSFFDFKADQEFESFVKGQDKQTGNWDYSYDEEKLILNKNGKEVRIGVAIIDEKMTWIAGDTTLMNPPYPTINLVKP